MALALAPESLLPAVLSAVGVVAVAAFLSSRWSAKPQATTTGDGRPLRRIHTLPTSQFLLGDLLGCIANEHRFHDWISEICLLFRGEPWRMRIIGQDDAIVVCTPDAFDAVLSSQFDDFPNGELSNEVLGGLFGRSIMTLDGAEWYHQRKTAAKFFTAKALRVCMLNIMDKNVKQMYETLDAGLTSGESVDLRNLVGQFTLQTFAEVGLGVDLRWIGKSERHPLAAAGEVASPATMRRFRVPVFWWKFERYVGFGPEKQMADGMMAVRKWLSTLIDQSLAVLAKRQAERQAANAEVIEDDEETIKSVVELFFEHSREDQTGMRSEDFVDFLLTFVVAAQDTSALTLVRFFLTLTQFPTVEQKIRREMAAVLPKLGVSHDTYLTTDHVNHLVYLEATIREVLRLFPTVPLMQKKAGTDTTICGGIPFRKGEEVILSLYAMARNPDVWGPDAAEFKPERWIDDKTDELVVVAPSRFASFSCGPRQCIGMKLGMLELRIVAANLVRRYAFTLAEPNDGSYVVGITLSMKHPVVVNVKPASEATVDAA